MDALTPPAVRIDARNVEMSRELFEALESPGVVYLDPVDEDTFFIKRGEQEWHSRRWLLKRYWRGWWGPPPGGIVAAFPRARGDRVRLRLLDHRVYLRQFPLRGEFRVANYHPLYLLMPARPSPLARSHDALWQDIEDYHEHRDVARQDPVTHRVSRWLAGVVAATGARSVLELGCGAGRNLHYLAQAIPGVRLFGVEINTQAADRARQVPGADDVRAGSVQDRHVWQDLHADVVLTSGFLMHLPAREAADVVRGIHARAGLAAFHFELHGPSHSFDYHRYPRDYRKFYEGLNLGTALDYEVFPTSDYRSAGLGHFNHALLVSRKAA
jgi:SAM-dependent methyltransferase